MSESSPLSAEASLSRFELPSAFKAAVYTAVSQARSRVWMFDPSFIDWPIKEAAFEDALLAFLSHHRGRVDHVARVVLQDLDRITRDYPRLARVIRYHGQLLECRGLPERLRQLDESLLIVDDHICVRRPSARRSVGFVRQHDAVYQNDQIKRFNELWDACETVYSTTQLGL